MSSPGPSVSRPSDGRPSRSEAAAPGTAGAGSVARADRADGRTSPRAKDRRKAAPLAKIGMVAFAIGLIAIFADFVLFAAGSHDLPLWLNLTAMLAPVGLGLGLIGLVKENRAASIAPSGRRAATGSTESS